MSVDHQGLEVAAEATAIQVSVGGGRWLLWHGFGFKSLVEDALDRAVLRAVEGERAGASRLQALITNFLAQPDDALCAAQVEVGWKKWRPMFRKMNETENP